MALLELKETDAREKWDRGAWAKQTRVNQSYHAFETR